MGRPPTFGLEALAAAGLSVVARDGWTAISVRSTADELGVTPMALYRVVPDARQLRRVVADAAAVPLRPGPRSGRLADELRTWATEAYRHLGRYPGLASFVIVEWTELPRWLDIVEDLLSWSDDDGLTGLDAVATVNAVFAYVLARSQLRDSVVAAPRRQLSPVRQRCDRYTRLRRNLGEYTTAKTDIHFAYGLDALTLGLAALHSRSSR